MSTGTVKNGTTIYYKDWGEGPAITFSHRWWPLNSVHGTGKCFSFPRIDSAPSRTIGVAIAARARLSARQFHAPAAAYHRVASLGRAAQLAKHATEKQILRLKYTVESLHRDAAEILR